MIFPRRKMLQTVSFAFGSSFMLSRNQLGIDAETTASPDSSLAEEGGMEKVTGIGGFFFRAKDPKALMLWYQQYLGISLIPTSAGQSPWQQEAGATAFAAFKETSTYFDPQKGWMMNFRVRNLDKMAAQLQAAGTEVKIDPQAYPNGRFAHLKDPEGNPLELWEPGRPAAGH